VGRGGRALRARYFDNWYFSYLLFNVANALISPLEVLYCRAEFNASMGEIGLLTASYYITLVPATFLWGVLLDKIGRRREIVAGMLFFVSICLYLVALADSVLKFVIINLLAGLGIAGLGPSATLIIVEQNEPKMWTNKISTFNFVASIGTVLGMISASIFLISTSVVVNSVENVNFLFQFTSGLTFLGSVLAFVFIRNDIKNMKRRYPEFVIILYDRVVEKRRYLPFMLYHLIYGEHVHRIGVSKKERLPSNLLMFYFGILTLYIGFAAFHALLPIYLNEQISLSQGSVFIVYSANAIATLISYKIAGILIMKHGGKAWMISANVVRGLVYLIMGFEAIITSIFAFNVFEVTTLYALSGVFWAFVSISGSTIVNSLSPSKIRGKAVGIFGAVIGLGNLTGSFLGGLLADRLGILGIFQFSAFLIFVGIFIVWFAVPGREDAVFEKLEKENAVAFIDF